MKNNSYEVYLSDIDSNLKRYISKKGIIPPNDIIDLALIDFIKQFRFRTAIFFSMLFIPVLIFLYSFLYDTKTYLFLIGIALYILFILLIFLSKRFFPAFSEFHSAKMKVKLVLKTYEGREKMLLENGQFKESLFENIYILEEKAIVLKKTLQTIEQSSTIDLSKVSKHELIKEYCKQVNESKGYPDNKNKDVLARLIALNFLLKKELKIGKEDEDMPFLLGSLIVGGKSNISRNYSSVLNKINNMEKHDYSELKEYLNDFRKAKESIIDALEDTKKIIEKISS